MARKIKNLTNDFTDVEVIRYFINNDTEYLIYSLNEIDESGYTKLYASKIIGTKACIITDNDEWTLIKEIIKEIVRNNRDGSELNIIDLDENALNDIVLQDTRVFKLQGNLVNLLSENKKVKEKIKEVPEEEIEEETEEEPEIEEVSLDYEELYKDQLEKNKDLEAEIDSLEEVINSKRSINLVDGFKKCELRENLCKTCGFIKRFEVEEKKK